jgi:hypothetical protein
MSVGKRSAMSRSPADEQEDFARRVATWIADSLATDHVSLGSLVRGLPAVDPTTVATVLRELAAGQGPGSETARKLIKASAMAPATTAPTVERPLPHPLDFYWAFNPESTQALLDELATATQPGDLIAYLGAPNLFARAMERLADRDHVLLDRSVPRTDALSSRGGRTVRLDLLQDAIPYLGADAAVLDPPWYPGHMRGFLWAAARVSGDGATIMATLPPAGTRPRAKAEVAEVLRWAADHGLRMVRQQTGAVRYLSPPFELASHRAAGLGGIPIDWRSGDLVSFRREEASAKDRPTAPEEHGVWLPFIIEEIPIWVRERTAGAVRIDAPLLESMLAGDVLRSVSSRDPIRERIDVWTSLNRVWASPCPLVVQSVCRALAEKGNPVNAVEADLGRSASPPERKCVRRAVDDLTNVVARERREHQL